jgi:ribosomal protein S18 acetylase RimI-like enzyme
MTTTVRPALTSDAPSLAAIKVATSPPRAVTDEPKRQSGPRFKAYTELIENHRGLVYVAETHGSVVGFLALQREGHPAVVGRNPVKLWQLYVAPALHGSGVASQLMSAAMDHARTHLHDVVWLGVSEHNARGVAFYRKHGFKALGLHLVGAGAHAHQDIVMSCLVH